MGLFDKKNKKEVEGLPDLPRLPELPEVEDTIKEPLEPLHQLPTMPNNSFGNEFSQNAIKEAVTGKKEVEGGFNADEFEVPDRMRMMHEPLKREFEVDMEPMQKPHFESKFKKIEPIFIRIDKFEEAMHLFEQAKGKINEIEKMLREVKSLREKEEKELHSWELELQKIKAQIDRVDKDIFSRLE